MTIALENQSLPPVIKPGSYLPYLDGLRGLAIVAVLWFHTYTSWFRGGFIGVDVFFVLSGFLITSLLIKEWDRSGRVNLPHFYARRALRLLPAVIVFLLVYLLVIAIARPAVLVQSSWNAVIVLFYSANWARVLGQPLYGLGHCWSLSIEEQFYLLWPVLFVGVMRAPARWRAGIVTGLAIALAVWRAIALLHGSTNNRLYNGLDTHGDGLLIGCALAFLTAGRERVELAAGHKGRSILAAAVAIGLLATSLIAREDKPASTWWMALIGFFAVAIASAFVVWDLRTRPGSVMRRITEWRPLVLLGRISYGVYLWHYPIYKATATMRESHGWRIKWPLYVPAAMLTIGVAVVSYRLVEVPFLRWKRKFQ